MSVIGPRPLLVEYLPYYTKEEHHRHDVRPGLSGWAQINGKKCYLIGPEEVSDTTFNSKLMQCFGAEIITVPVENVHETIEEQLHKLKKSGKKPYFIPGGGHGNLGTQAYVNCYNEIKEYTLFLFSYIIHQTSFVHYFSSFSSSFFIIITSLYFIIYTSS